MLSSHLVSKDCPSCLRISNTYSEFLNVSVIKAERNDRKPVAQCTTVGRADPPIRVVNCTQVHGIRTCGPLGLYLVAINFSVLLTRILIKKIMKEEIAQLHSFISKIDRASNDYNMIVCTLTKEPYLYKIYE